MLYLWNTKKHSYTIVCQTVLGVGRRLPKIASRLVCLLGASSVAAKLFEPRHLRSVRFMLGKGDLERAGIVGPPTRRLLLKREARPAVGRRATRDDFLLDVDGEPARLQLHRGSAVDSALLVEREARAIDHVGRRRPAGRHHDEQNTRTKEQQHLHIIP